MAQKKLPAMQWYPGDWRKDPGIQALDYYDRGVWRELLDVMHESDERGRLVFPTGAPMPDAAIARLLGITEADWKQIRSRLLSYGVASEDEDGVLYNRRMVRDEELRQAKVEAGRKGGRKSRPSKKGANTEAKQGSSVSASVSASTKVTTAEDKSSEAVASKNGSRSADEPPPIDTIADPGQRIGAYLAHFMPIVREVGLSDDDTNGSIIKALAKRRAPPEGLEQAIRGLPLVASDMNGGELKWIYAAKRDEIAEPAWNRAKRAYVDSQKGKVSPMIREMVG